MLMPTTTWAMLLRERGKFEEAIEAYNKALAINPDYADAYCNMGNALADQGKLEEAIEALQKALSLNPDNAEVTTTWVCLQTKASWKRR